ncbi:hypothetical protein VST7929_01321 [Vibrio stylophorae]|uniref:Nucleotide-binding protein VST7929_01321 n=1 Tax=Vibrio stylophorae TaxID=659351 RepID=A0ABN8DSD6_9VIBR|nr:YajQ family cyclic di-GMP-binding protein [Vibrio stylophorae]CAH0533453.1 hypothetical protein VST7929_01321 [Vibrio stylophorae]
MPSFDIISEIDLVEARNAVDNSTRELSTRFDFRGVEASFALKDNIVTMKAESDFQLNQMREMLRANMARRQLDANSLDVKDFDHIGKSVTQELHFKQGIDSQLAKKMVKMIKDSKIKVQASIQGDKLRITGKKRDDLQEVIAFVRSNSEELGQAFQYENFRD